MTVRKNISLPQRDYDIIAQFARARGYTFSELLRQATLEIIKKQEDLGLAQFLAAHVDPVSEEEQAEIDSLGIDFDDLTGVELSIDDII